MRLYALTDLLDPEAIELFINEEDAKRALGACLRDEPDWRGLLRVEEVEVEVEVEVDPNTCRSTSYLDTDSELVFYWPECAGPGSSRSLAL